MKVKVNNTKKDTSYFFLNFLSTSISPIGYLFEFDSHCLPDSSQSKGRGKLGRQEMSSSAWLIWQLTVVVSLGPNLHLELVLPDKAGWD